MVCFSDANVCSGFKRLVSNQANFVSNQAVVDYQRFILQTLGTVLARVHTFH